MKKLKVRRIGNSLGTILPRDMLDRMRIDEGDEIPMNYSFKRSQKGTGMMASRSQMERTPRGERVVVTRDEIIGKDGKPMNPRSSGKAYGLWRQRPVDADPDMQRQSADSRIKAKLAAKQNINVTLDAEEADRLELTLDLFGALGSFTTSIG